jgi:hypothetical protein
MQVYIPETIHAFRVYNVADILWLRFVVQVIFFPMIKVLYLCVSTFRSGDPSGGAASVCGRALAGIVGSNPTGGMDVCLL